MARTATQGLTPREIEVMQVFWRHGELTPQAARDLLAATDKDRAYTTVATQIRILSEKGFLLQTTDQRPFRYRPTRSFEEVSSSLLGDLLERVFHGSREQMLIRLLEQKKLSPKERARLEQIVRENRC